VSGDENRALLRRFFEGSDQGDLETIEEFIAPDFVDHSLNPGQEPDRDGYLRSLVRYHATFSHCRTSIDYLATDGDMMISRVTTRNFHAGVS
jgi:ketosteroid isomerase-like protein